MEETTGTRETRETTKMEETTGTRETRETTTKSGIIFLCGLCVSAVSASLRSLCPCSLQFRCVSVVSYLLPSLLLSPSQPQKKANRQHLRVHLSAIVAWRQSDADSRYLYSILVHCLLDSYCNSYGCTHHRVVTHTEEAHHLDVCWY